MVLRTVKDLKEFLQEQLDNLECYDDEEKLKLVSNTYFLGNQYCFLALENGYLDFDDPVKENDEEE